MPQRTVLVTGTNGYIGYRVAKAFVRAGWKTYGLIRRIEGTKELAKNEIHPLVGSPSDLSFLEQTDRVVFDVVVSNTEDNRSVETHLAHLEDVTKMFEVIAKRSLNAGIRPLIIFTSGCKDYGSMGSARHGDRNLKPHTEESPLIPPERLRGRANMGQKLLDGNKLYDAIVTRPTIVHGYNSSHVGGLFATASKSQSVLRIVGDPNTIMHSLHVDDCAEAYVRLADHPAREDVAGQAFNISNASYETVEQVCQALAKAYGLPLELVAPLGLVSFTSTDGLTNFSQWVSSEKLRKITGWKEKRPTFTEGIQGYRMAYEATQGV